MSNLARIVDYHRKELYYPAVRIYNQSKKTLKYHGEIRRLYRTDKIYFWLKTLKWFFSDLPTFINCWWHRKNDISYFIESYWDTKYRRNVQFKLEKRLNKYAD